MSNMSSLPSGRNMLIKCDHCDAVLESVNLSDPSKAIVWCKDCLLNGGRELLLQHGVNLFYSDEWYAKQGYTFWLIGSESSKEIKEIPKKGQQQLSLEPVPMKP